MENLTEEDITSIYLYLDSFIDTMEKEELLFWEGILKEIAGDE